MFGDTEDIIIAHFFPFKNVKECGFLKESLPFKELEVISGDLSAGAIRTVSLPYS